MKNKRFIITATLVLGLMACSKEVQDNATDHQTATIESAEPLKLDNTFKGSVEDMAEAIELIGMNDIIIVSQSNLEEEMFWTVYEKFDKSIRYVPAKAPVCEGGGVAFVKRCKAQLDKGKCLIIEASAGGNYTANLTPCP